MAAKGFMKDQTGRKFGRLTIISLHERSEKSTMHKWLCQCTCGKTVVTAIQNLRTGNTRSCGCLFTESLVKRNTKHGLTHDHKGAYRSWKDMRQRCNNPNNKSYDDYGGRGIKICERWNSFANFFADMGDRPEKHSIDRIDVNGNYEPNNCRWATDKEQARNKRNNHIMENGKTLAENCEIVGVDFKVVSYRISQGYSFDEALSKKDFRIVER